MLLTKHECAEVIDACSEHIYPATVHVGGDPYVDESLRKASMCYPDDIEGLQEILAKARETIRRVSKRPIENQERFQYCRYKEGDFFDWHVDGPHREMTFLVYLNEGYEGGNTEFEGGKTYRGQCGEMLGFHGGLKHRSTPITKGEKHVLVCWARSAPVPSPSFVEA